MVACEQRVARKTAKENNLDSCSDVVDTPAFCMQYAHAGKSSRHQTAQHSINRGFESHSGAY